MSRLRSIYVCHNENVISNIAKKTCTASTQLFYFSFFRKYSWCTLLFHFKTPSLTQTFQKYAYHFSRSKTRFLTKLQHKMNGTLILSLHLTNFSPLTVTFTRTVVATQWRYHAKQQYAPTRRKGKSSLSLHLSAKRERDKILIAILVLFLPQSKRKPTPVNPFEFQISRARNADSPATMENSHRGQVCQIAQHTENARVKARLGTFEEAILPIIRAHNRLCLKKCIVIGRIIDGGVTGSVESFKEGRGKKQNPMVRGPVLF